MENDNIFIPGSEEEKLYNSLSQFMSSKLRGLDEKYRLAVLRYLNVSDLSLKTLYSEALKQEDYETCEVAKIFLALLFVI
jgi:hypothetical protein